jgi:predicted lipoprotein with Yx(FWY)xxD motif
MNRHGTARLAGALLGIGLLAGCTGPAPQPSPGPGESAFPAPAGLFVVANGAGRQRVIDGQGFTLYRYDRDSAHPSRSSCLAECAVRWPPVPWSAQLRLVGIDRQLVGRLDRPDGTAQATLAGWPLYGYAADRVPGEITGAGVDGKWWAIGPRGERLD